MEWVLGGATLLGGIAALFYFWDRIPNRFKSTDAPDAAKDSVSTEKWVDLSYPRNSGLQARLESEGFRVRWCREDKLARRLDADGWELVVDEADGAGGAVLKVADRPCNQVLVKRRTE